MRMMTRGFSAAVVALSAALGLNLAGAHRSMAAPNQSQTLDNGPRLRLLSPTARATFQGAKPIEIDALYEGVPGNGIVSLDLYIDGVKAQTQALNAPETKGMVSFLVDSSLMTPGPHIVVVRATAADAEVRSVRGSFSYQSGSESDISVPGGSGDPNALDWPSVPGAAPQMRLIYPAPNATIQGKVTIQVDASDADGKPPYVSIFVDGEMKQLVNYRPFEYEWDTTPLPNGWHTIAIVEAFDSDSIPVAHIKPFRVYVNNPGGQTFIRQDLLDAPKPVKPAFTRPIAPVATRHALPALPRLSDLPAPHLKAAAPQKTLAARPLVRRPLGDALLAAMSGPAAAAKHHTLIASLDPRWDGSETALLPALTEPTIVNLPTPPAPAPHPKTALRMPTSGFKPLVKSVLSPAVRPSGLPVIAAAPGGKSKNVIPQRLRSPMLMAEGGLLDDEIAAPLLSLPELPTVAAPHKVQVVIAPHPAAKETIRPVLTLALPAHSPATIKPHVGIGGASLLRAIGEKQVQFNQTSLALERPLADRQNILFGPLRRIFEYGGGSLEWDAHSGTVRAQTAQKDIRLKIGDRTASINNRPFTLNGVPYINNGRTMVPLSFVGVAMNANVQYDPATGHLKITSRQ